MTETKPSKKKMFAVLFLSVRYSPLPMHLNNPSHLCHDCESVSLASSERSYIYRLCIRSSTCIQKITRSPSLFGGFMHDLL
mmetsp:Transcript_9344/g.10825  ORF Transcript_9344/g.10825 Transcript_9344/m.10825 type:complete len:81 (+) Transcript_9344:127-369(+)